MKTFALCILSTYFFLLPHVSMGQPSRKNPMVFEAGLKSASLFTEQATFYRVDLGKQFGDHVVVTLGFAKMIDEVTKFREPAYHEWLQDAWYVGPQVSFSGRLVGRFGYTVKLAGGGGGSKIDVFDHDIGYDELNGFYFFEAGAALAFLASRSAEIRIGTSTFRASNPSIHTGMTHGPALVAGSFIRF